MKVINTGSTYNIYNNNLKTYDAFPAQVYKICFSEMSGFRVEKYHDIEINEKIYGSSKAKAVKTLATFNRSQKNIGVILSGPKGIGKSITAKLIVEQALENNYPVFVVDNYISGIASYIDSIEQECVILFDEFDKTFSLKDEAQAEMLTLFDGINVGIKKLFVVTCNELRCLNEFLINRPGRFHYHFRFDYPNDEEIECYLKENLESTYWKEIPEVIKFANKVCLNYDCLRAIAFELSAGLSFKEAIKDLNIVNTDEMEYTVCVELKTGQTGSRLHYLDMCDSDKCYVRVNCENYIVEINFEPDKCKYNVNDKCYVIPLDTSYVEVYGPRNSEYDYDDDEEENDNNRVLEPDIVKSATIRIKRSNSIGYSL
jgi:hypothetical protein